MMLIPEYHLQFTFGYQIRFRSVSSGIKNVQKYRVVLGFMKRARAGLWIESHYPVPTLAPAMNTNHKNRGEAVLRKHLRKNL